ncbi:uncharacterized protein LOC114537187 isoform X4 [Dendronephthya gigantea]|uniref:uncharacterized protein LOC114526902 isoform X4 n=1 Tax=Dendronephthya gigantea TaxID=151771 RepID=UPI00106CFB4E|nr:uncharacterized protein LOC114526902 isoform X4 [Dendronephthya gigantea]XP_028411454.1 uncharacterized protein LOC114534011 isoform X2 [Dendronephthya gigantea]XP_028413591.1 uncharacterized protein LOC114536431 isoform X1 [Dendronephthya gigantea]XP_028414114.1 uncharacterized protein LOC114537187 isoform X4 [Dendronephthya gigantea]
MCWASISPICFLFGYHQHLFKTMKQFVLQQKPDNVCPLCPLQSETDTDKNVAIECMDGCFGLVRKKSAGANLLPARHNGTFFANQDDVDSFVDDNSKKAKQAPTDCNEFKSGEVSNMLRSKGRNKLFDEKGVFGRVCRHEYPRGFMSIKHGERIAYSVYEVKKLLCHYDEDTDVKIMYDIACTLSAHLKKNEEHTILGRIDLAIPVFHAYGHKSSCQVAFGPRRKEGFGLTDGEGIERLWSYLRGFSSMTKEMTAGRRVDVLTDALLHHARHRLLQFGPALLSKMQKTKKLMENSVVQLEEIFSDLKVSYGTDVINSWMKAEENMLLMRGKRKPSPMSWEAKYVQNLVFLQELRQGIASTEAENHETINELVKRKKAILKIVMGIEKSYKVHPRWRMGEEKFNVAALSVLRDRRNQALEKLYSLAVERMFLLNLKRKYADGQAIAEKVSKQITQRTNSAKVVVEKYNASLAAWKDNVTGLPEELEFDKVKDPESDLYKDFRESTLSEDQVPYSVKKSAIDLHNFIERCKEETSYLKTEMCRLVTYHQTQKSSFLEWLKDNNDSSSTVLIRGIRCILQRKILEEENKLIVLGATFGNHLPDNVSSSIPKIEWSHESTMPSTKHVFENLDQLDDQREQSEEQDDEILSILDSSDDEVEDESEMDF